jgi:hypothetical protein
MQQDDRELQNPELRPTSCKQPYQRPLFIKWGTLKEMTQQKGTGPNADGGIKSATNKTGRGGHYGDYW